MKLAPAVEEACAGDIAGACICSVGAELCACAGIAETWTLAGGIWKLTACTKPRAGGDIAGPDTEAAGRLCASDDGRGRARAEPCTGAIAGA
mmetsp:Transcript_8983/g.19851  ORF Transcript_8983/g.19851 Transcript_8983/m.19851 type:complete len:92 (+) Transcript_8983:899-1174(+)